MPTHARPGSGDLCLQAGAGAATGGSSPSLGSAFRDDRDRCRLWHSQFLASLGQARAALHQRGRLRLRGALAPRGAAGRSRASGAREITDAQPEEAWQTVEWREGSRGTLRKQFVAIRVHAGTGCARHSETHGRSWTRPEGWLLGERPLPGEEGDPKWFFSCLPADTPLSRLVELAHLRWPIEQFYEDAKGECGLDHYQGRSWDGLHRHLALVMLAYSFLMLQSLVQEVQTDPAPGATFPPIRQLSLPACHRLVLVLLFQDVVLWLIETEQIKAFRLRRN